MIYIKREKPKQHKKGRIILSVDEDWYPILDNMLERIRKYANAKDFDDKHKKKLKKIIMEELDIVCSL